MKNTPIKSVALASVTLSVLAAHTSAHAEWPKDQPITIVAPFAAGGTADALARQVASGLSAKLGQTVIVENKPGAGSMIGTKTVASSKADGYTLLMGSTANVLHKYFYKKPLYELKDLAPVTLVVKNPLFLGANKNLPVNNLSELVRYAKENPGKLSCANAGVGSTPYLSCELFTSLAGVDIVNVSYRGGAPAIADVIGGNAKLFIQSEGLRYIQDGQVKGLGVTSDQRSAYLPNVPAIGEVVKGYKVSQWYGIFAPAGLPANIKQSLSKAIDEVVQSQKFKKDSAAMGADVVGGTPDDFAAFMKEQVGYFDQVVPGLKLQVE